MNVNTARQCDLHRLQHGLRELKRRGIAALKHAANERAWRALAIQSIKAGHYDIAKARIEAAERERNASYV